MSCVRGRGSRDSIGSGDFVCALVRRILAFVSLDRMGGAFIVVSSDFPDGIRNSPTPFRRAVSCRFAFVAVIAELGENPRLAR